MEKTNALQLYTDGGSRGNPGKAAIGVVIKSGNGDVVFSHGETIGETTNNVAEYKALIFALSKASEFLSSHDAVFVYMDSNLIVNQMKGSYKIKKAHLMMLHEEAKMLEQKLALPVTYVYILREHNHIADQLLNSALDNTL